MAAERAQQYLDLHKVGPLFENLMASLIKDMPNEPITYLIRMLQKADQKLRSPRGMPDRAKSASASVLHSKYGIGVSGHAAPKRSIEEPHTALPGGGKAGALWSSTNLSSSHGRPSSGYGRPKTAEQKKRGYEKPWLSGTKPATKKTAQTTEHKPEKSAPEHRETSAKKKTTTWNADTKVIAKDFDEMLPSKKEEPTSPDADNQQKDILYLGVKSWAAGDENSPPSKKISIQENRRALLDMTNDEIDIRDIDLKKNNNQMDVDGDMKIPVSKNFKASHKADQKRMKLKALLDENDKIKSICNGHDDDESGDDETIEVFEHSDDLEGEGVQKTSKSGAKLKGARQRNEGANFQIKICARCAKVMATYQTAGGFSDFDSQVTATRKTVLSDIAGSEDNFDSVSQIADPKTQKWPIIAPDDGESPAKVAMTSGSAVSMSRTDFFEANAPSRSTQIQKEMAESEAGSQMNQSHAGNVQAWVMKPAESSTDFQP